MIYRINPTVPLVWRTPDTIQLGVDDPLVVFPGVTSALMQVLEALRAGVPRSGAILLGREAGASDAEILALLRRLRPALLGDGDRQQQQPDPPAPAPPVVYVDGAGPTATRIRSLLYELGYGIDALRNTTATPTATPVGSPAENPVTEQPAPPTIGLAILVGHYALDPVRHGRWLNRDIPHLPVVFGDSSIRLGPLVEPGNGPCLYCLELAHIDLDPAWPAMAAQLLRATAHTETTRASIDVAARVAGLVDDRFRTGAHPLFGESLSVSAATGKVRHLVHLPHERCGCRSLPENVTALVGNAAAGPMQPSSATADAVPA
jgi:bacteriocin biosynthesis cyclodehydratase domain-containing protein